MAIKVIRDSIVVTKDDAAKTTASGLFVAHAETKVVSGTVVSVGSGRLTMGGTVVPLEVSVGDKVLFNKSLATEVSDDEKPFFVLKEEYVICVIK